MTTWSLRYIAAAVCNANKSARVRHIWSAWRLLPDTFPWLVGSLERFDISNVSTVYYAKKPALAYRQYTHAQGLKVA